MIYQIRIIQNVFDKKRYIPYKASLFIFDAEKMLYTEVQKISYNGNYEEYLKALISINSTVTKFFDDVLVMDKDENIKNNRLALLNILKNKYIMLTDFSKLNI